MELVRRGTVGHLHQAKMEYFHRNRKSTKSKTNAKGRSE